MRNYTFRLGSVLRIRRAEEERERLRLMRANATLRALIIQRDEQTNRYQCLAHEPRGTSFEDFFAGECSMTLAARSVAHAQRAVTTAAGDAALAQIAWIASSRKVEIIERLEERKRLEHTEAQRKEDVELANDLFTTRYVFEQATQPFEPIA